MLNPSVDGFFNVYFRIFACCAACLFSHIRHSAEMPYLKCVPMIRSNVLISSGVFSDSNV